jgi:hypothetical protein
MPFAQNGPLSKNPRASLHTPVPGSENAFNTSVLPRY